MSYSKTLKEWQKRGVGFKAPNRPVISPLLDKVIVDNKKINARYVSRAMREYRSYWCFERRSRSVLFWAFVDVLRARGLFERLVKGVVDTDEGREGKEGLADC